MFFNMAVQNTHIRAYIRAIPGLPIVRQREMAADAGCGVVYEYREFKHMDIRAQWAKAFQPGDTAWLPSILVLVTPPADRKPRSRPVSDMAAVIADVLARGAIIVDGRTGITSKDGSRWANHVEWAAAKASQGERSLKSQRKAISAAHAARGPGMVARWRAPAKKADRDKARAIWCSTLYSSDDEARAWLPEELSTLSGSSLRRIFGPRRPGDKRAGGRPKIS